MVYIFKHETGKTKVILANDLVGIPSEQKKKLAESGWTIASYEYDYAHAPKDMREMVEKLYKR